MCLPMSQMDAQYAATRATYAKPRHYRERLMAELAAGIAMRFGPLASLAAMHGTPNATVCCYNTWRGARGSSTAWRGMGAGGPHFPVCAIMHMHMILCGSMYVVGTASYVVSDS